MNDLKAKMLETKKRKRAQRRAAKAKIASMTRAELKKFRSSRVKVERVEGSKPAKK